MSDEKIEEVTEELTDIVENLSGVMQDDIKHILRIYKYIYYLIEVENDDVVAAILTLAALWRSER